MRKGGVRGMNEKTRNRLWWAGGVLLLVIVLALSCGHKEDATPGAGSTTTKNAAPVTGAQDTYPWKGAVLRSIYATGILPGTITRLQAHSVNGDTELDITVEVPKTLTGVERKSRGEVVLSAAHEGMTGYHADRYEVLVVGNGGTPVYGTSRYIEGHSDVSWTPGAQ
jgi:hypothetical protein